MMRMLAAAMLLGACASPPEQAAQGYWRYVHDSNGPQETRSDEAICRVGYLSSPRAAALERSALEPCTLEHCTLRKTRGRMRQAEHRHVSLCMTALGYERLWFDADGCLRGCAEHPRSIARRCAEYEEPEGEVGKVAERARGFLVGGLTSDICRRLENSN